jgi:hypothetical protein|tara:strand:+ start:505 stop:765 length:261 start_codon:yes stop_codon:yes gene_type:complete
MNNTIDPFLYFGVKNSYRILINKTTLEEIIDESSMQSGNINDHNPPIFFIGPDEDYDNEDIDSMIDVFEVMEDYEKCAELIKLKTT